MRTWSRIFFYSSPSWKNAKVQINFIRSLNLGEQNSMSIQPEPPWDPQIDSNELCVASPPTLSSSSSESTLIIDSPLLEYSICQILVGDIEKNDSVSFLHCNVITENWSINYETSWILYFCASIAVHLLHFKGVTMIHFPRNINVNCSFCKDQGLVKA